MQIIGASSAVPNPGSATSCYLVRSPTADVLLECGHGAVGALRRYADPAGLGAVLITHMHPDHCFDLVALRNHRVVHALPRLPLYLPETGPAVLRSLGEALGLGAGYFDPAFEVRTYAEGPAFEVGGLTVEAVRSRHNTLAHAVRFTDPDGARLVFSSDTGWFPGLAELAAGAEVLLIEVTDPATPAAGPRWHLCPADAARVIDAARPGLALLTHYAAATADRVLADTAARCPGVPVRLAREGEVHRVAG
nr:MBL fold metallo-hydrolase [Kitasatospora sp. SID7827]